MHHSASITLLLGPAACGKTEAALEALQAPRRGRALLLVPNQLQRTRLKARLSGTPRVGVHQFYSLSSMLLRRAGIAVAPLSDTLRTRLLRQVVGDLATAGQLPTFGQIAHKAGFQAMLAALIVEAQEAEVAPQTLAAADVTPYDRDLAAVYAAYLTVLARLNLADGVRRLALAGAALRRNSRLLARLELVVVDGFDQFTPLQTSLLAALTAQADRSLITLTGDTTERPAHRRFSRTRDQLVAALQPQVQTMTPNPAAADQRAPLLAFVEQHLFNLDTPAATNAAGALTSIRAADREREVRAALRQVRLLLNGGTTPDQIALIYRTGGAYVPLLREIAAEYDLPIAIYEGLPLAEAPSVVALLTMLRLPLDDYPRRDLVEVWRSLQTWAMPAEAEPQAPADEADPAPPGHQRLIDPQSAMVNLERAASLLDRAGRNAGVAGGLTRLRTMLTALANAEPMEADDDLDGPTLAPAVAAELLAVFDAFAVWLAPPPEATVGAYVDWLRKLWVRGYGLGGMRDEEWRMENGEWAVDDAPQSPIPNPQSPTPDHERAEIRNPKSEIRNPTPDPQSPTPDHERAEIQNPKSKIQNRMEALLTDLADAAETLAEPPVAYRAFVADLAAAVATARYGRGEPTAERVAVLSTLDARGMGFDHVVLLGLAEGEFPLRLPDPPLYSRRERQRLAERGVPLLPPNPADERSLFYETIARARRSLTLTRTYLDESGNTLPASAYHKALLGLVDPASVVSHEIRAGSVPPLDEAASPQETLVALMTQPLALSPPLAAPIAQLLAHARRACTIEQRREATDGYDHFEGLVDDPALQAELAQRFGPRHRWSVTQLNDYITCPFRFAAAHVLHLDRRGEPEDGLEFTTRGRIYHAILAKAGEHWITAAHPHNDANEQAILDTLKDATAEVLDVAPEQFGFEPGVFWDWDKADVQRRLNRAFRRVLQESKEWAAFRPARVEQSFGLDHGAKPLHLETSAGKVQIAGRIDRIDQHDTDKTLAVIDYKSSSTPRPPSEAVEGRNLQLAIYLLAVEQLIAPRQPVVQAAFLHLGSGKRSKPLAGESRDQAVAAAIERVGEVVAGVRTGNFAVRPRDDCPTGCAFKDICRLNIAKRDAHAAG